MPYEHIDQLVPHWWVRVTAGVGTGDIIYQELNEIPKPS